MPAWRAMVLATSIGGRGLLSNKPKVNLPLLSANLEKEDSSIGGRSLEGCYQARMAGNGSCHVTWRERVVK